MSTATVSEISVKAVVSPSVASDWKRLLSLDKADEQSGKDEVIDKIVIDIGHEMEVDIKLVNSESGPYIDAILFDNSHEVVVLEPIFDELVGEFIFDYEYTQDEVSSTVRYWILIEESSD